MRPKLKTELHPLDKVIILLGLLGIALSVYFPLFFYDSLPEQIPTHFNARGEADDYSDRQWIWTLPFITWLIFFGLMALSRYPHLYNYPVKITEENATRLYPRAQRMIRIIALFTVYLFVFIIYGIIQNALGEQEKLSAVIVPLFVGAIFLSTAYFAYHALKNK